MRCGVGIDLPEKETGDGAARVGEDGIVTSMGRAAPAGRSWLVMLGLSRVFVTLIFMSYAASLPTLTGAGAMTSTQAGLVQAAFSTCHRPSRCRGSRLPRPRPRPSETHRQLEFRAASTSLDTSATLG